MTVEQAAEAGVDAVVEYDGRVLLVKAQGAWKLPSGDPEPAEPAQATAARAVYELTGYLVDGTTLLRPAKAAPGDARRTVVCQLLSEAPSGDARLSSEEFRWAPIAEAVDAGIPETARVYLEGHTPV
ncbi:NUDIX domain-containing protein [Streptomyces sediminimaris]|uniref:NUDIX domain-containing protein n=1 Tax=Streptomyces sediminimaris TaxID=3383721 RepID=UPI003999CE79